MFEQLTHNMYSGPALMLIAAALTFFLTLGLLAARFSFLPRDHGRAFAVDGEKSEGKLRGVGLLFVLAFVAVTISFTPFRPEYLIYCALLILVMLSGYLDDAADTPWADYKKGAIDLVLSIGTMAVFVWKNPTAVTLFGNTYTLPVPLYFILGIILIFTAINVTNCADGVDGLSASVVTVSLLSFILVFSLELDYYATSALCFAGALLAYLVYNTSPSSMLMGDAGSRAMGFFLALLSMKSGHPFVFIAFCAVLIIDGGLGLVKLFLKRYLHISILKNTLTPIHDHLRKNLGWSDTQVVIRYVIIQIVISVLVSVFL